MTEHLDLLRKWLRGKGFHPADIKYALTWYAESVKAGSEPTDFQVLEVAEKSHTEAVGLVPPTPLQVIHQKRVVNELSETVIHTLAMDTAFWGSLLGAGSALALYEVLKWAFQLTL